MKLQHLLLCAHLTGVIVWLGGMCFAHLCLRPAAAALPPAQRLNLWAGVLGRFFPLVWVSLALILASGFAMIASVGFAGAPRAWHAMTALGLMMTAIFVSIWLGPWPALRQAVAAESWAQGAQAMNRIRQRVTINLVLGFLTVLLATLGLAF